MKLKRTLCIALSFLIVFCASGAFVSFASLPLEKPKIYQMSADGYSSELFDEDGNIAPAPKKALKSRSGAKESDFPSAYDSRESGIIPAVRDQGRSGACWAFSSVAALEVDAVKKGLISIDNADFSESHLVWFTYSADQNKSSPLYDEYYISSTPYLIGGNWSRAAATFAKWSGPAKESDYPFSGSTTDFSAMCNYDESGRYDHSSGIIIDSVDILSSRADIKEWITVHGACTAAIYVSDSYFDTEHNSYYSTSTGLNHMITLVGWDDEFPAGNFLNTAPGDGAWLVRDSWGTYSHEDGYFWLSYYENSISNIAGFTARSDEGLIKNYNYSAVGYTAAFSYTNGVSVANFFKPEQYEKIDSVSFYTHDPQTTVLLKVYTGVPNSAKDPTSGTLAYSESVFVDNQGYHTVSLSSKISVAPGSRFAVSLSYSNAANSLMIPSEQLNTTSNGVKYTCSSGQSACMLPGSDNNRWHDAMDYTLGNFPIQAFTVCDHQSAFNTEKDRCDVEGTLTEYCSQCGKTLSESVIPATNHAFGSWFYDGNGVFKRDCSDCDAFEVINDCGLSVEQLPSALTQGDTFEIVYSADERIQNLIRFESSDPNVASVDAFGKIKALKPGTVTITARLDGSDIFNSYDIIIEKKFVPLPDIFIVERNQLNEQEFDYKSSFTFYYKAENAEKVSWHVNGASFTVNPDLSCTVKEAKNDFSVYCTAANSEGEAVASETETIHIKHGFFDIIVAFFKSIFKGRPVYIQK